MTRTAREKLWNGDEIRRGTVKEVPIAVVVSNPDKASPIVLAGWPETQRNPKGEEPARPPSPAPPSLKQGYWEIGIDTWVICESIDDGIYTGQEVSLIVSLYEKNFKVSSEAKKYAEPLGNCHYKINALVVYATDKLIIVDFGIVATFSYPPSITLQAGDYIEAEVYLFTYSPFMEMTEFTENELQLLTRNWYVKEIFQITAPFTAYTDKYKGQVMVGDRSKVSAKKIEQTNAEDDYDQIKNQYVMYQLNCIPKTPHPSATILEMSSN